MKIHYKDFQILSNDHVFHLYKDAGWTSYTTDMKSLLFGIQNSSFVYTAWDDHTLVGLIRVVSDDYTICYIQDILVLKAYQRQGIGRQLMKAVMDKYDHVRQMVLLTEASDEGAIAFYQKLGFEINTKHGCVSLSRVKKK